MISSSSPRHTGNRLCGEESKLLTNFIHAQVRIDPADFPARVDDSAQRTGSKGEHAVDHVAALLYKRPPEPAPDYGFQYRLNVHLATTAHQTQNGIRGTGTQRLIRLLLNKVPARNLVEQFNQDREANCGVQITFRNMEAKTFRYQAQTNHQQEAQSRAQPPSDVG